MKQLKTTLLLLCLIIGSQFTFSQEKAPSYKDIVGENPKADTDIKVVSDYVNALVGNDMSKAEKLLSDIYIGYGPALNDSITKKETIKSWTEIHQVRSNEKVNFVSATIRVKQGEYKGDWVYQWGTYSFTQNGKDIQMPYQLTVFVNNGKIEKSTIYYDDLSVAKALGYQLVPPKQ
ncbi:hypothetical protein [Lacinutrix salivirga]